MLLHDHVENAARRSPSAPALVSPGGTRTYAELSTRVRRLVAAATMAGARGDRVAVLGENSVEYVEMLIGIPSAARILVLLNPRSAPHEMADVVARSGATVLVAEPGFAAGVDTWRGESALRQVVWIGDVVPETAGAEDSSYEQWIDVPPATRWPVSDDRDDAWLIYTSGTTGRSKGVVLSHRAVSAAGAGFLFEIRPAAGLRMLLPFTLSHVTAHAAIAVFDGGGTLVLQRRFNPREYVRAIAEHRVTVAAVAPAMLAMILADDEGSADTSSLEILFYGSSPISPTLIRAGMERFPGVSLVQAYGQTESTGAAVWLDAAEHRRGVAEDEGVLQCAGRPGPFVGTRVVDWDGVDVPDGEAGEVILRGDQVMSRYWEDPDSTSQALRDGWLYTGDIAVRGADGLLKIVDRKKDLIISGGENISSVELENALAAHPEVAEVAVIGVPDEILGEIVCAVIVRKPGTGLDEAGVVEFARRGVASYKKPRRVCFVDSLPRNSTGKILKSRLRATYPTLATAD